MTSLSSEDVSCCVCGKSSSHTVMRSTNQLSAPDLDTRPGEMMRSTIGYWVQRCPGCGYSAPDISECSPVAKAIVRSEDYQNRANNKDIPDLAASFLALSYEKQVSHEYTDAAWRAVHAAWVCDDKQNDKAAIECRKQALAMIEQCAAHSQVFARQAGATEAITIDLMRRAGMLQEARVLAEQTKKREIDDLVEQIISYEEGLIRNNDVSAHAVSEVIG